MAFEKVVDLDCEQSISLGGKDKKTGKANPTSITGYFLGTRKIEGGQYGESKLHIFQTPKGNVGVWGKTNLDSKLSTVTPGTMARITFVGMVPTKNKPMYKFSVEIDTDNVIQLGSASEESTEASYSEVQDSYEEESDLDSEETAEDEVAYVPPVNRKALSTPSASAQARVKALLGKNKAS